MIKGDLGAADSRRRVGAEPEDKDLRRMYELMEESRTLHAWRDVRRPTLSAGAGGSRKVCR